MLWCILFVEVKFLVAWNLLFSLQPSKLDLDVFMAIGQVDIDSGKYPSIAQWKKLVMSYSEATQQRWHFIYFNFKLIYWFLLVHFFPSFFPVPLPSICPCLSHSLTTSLSASLPVSFPPSLPPSLPPFLSLSLSPSLPPCFPHSFTLCLSPCLPHSLPPSLPDSPFCLSTSLPTFPASLPASTLPPRTSQK